MYTYDAKVYNTFVKRLGGHFDMLKFCFFLYLADLVFMGAIGLWPSRFPCWVRLSALILMLALMMVFAVQWAGVSGLLSRVSGKSRRAVAPN